MISQVAMAGAGLLADTSFDMIRSRFGCRLVQQTGPTRPNVWIDARVWSSLDADLLAFDRTMHEVEDLGQPICLGLCGLERERMEPILQILTRYQRLLPYPVPVTLEPGLLEFHRSLFDLRKPLVRADYDHSLDTWRWLLYIENDASLALQLAALYHDVERLWSEADARTEQNARNYVEFKRQHAKAGAERVAALLDGVGIAPHVIERVRELIARHEEPNEDPELAALNDADALSFFSLNGWGFYRYFGPEHTRTKVNFTLRRMRPNARRELPKLRQHPAILEYLHLGSGGEK